MRIFIGKHPCDDLPYILAPDPDPRDDEFDKYRGIDGNDYSGWYVKERKPDYEAMAEVMLQKIDVAAWWTRDNRQLLAEQLWAAGIGGDNE